MLVFIHSTQYCSKTANNTTNRDNINCVTSENSTEGTPITEFQKKNRNRKSNESTPEQDLRRIRDNSSELLNISDESYGSDSEAFEMEERKLQLSIGDLIKERE
jgi:hypothetical protein